MTGHPHARSYFLVEKRKRDVEISHPQQQTKRSIVLKGHQLNESYFNGELGSSLGYNICKEYIIA